MRPWTVHGCTVHHWQSQLIVGWTQKKKKKKEKNAAQNVNARISAIQTVT